MNASQRYERLHRLFEAVRDLTPPEREKMLAERCGDDAALRSEVEQLLERHAEPGGFLQRPALGSSFSVEAAATVVEPASDLLGKRIGHYHLKRVIASGGMGTVYEATQEKPRRTVAVKVMRQGIASKSALRRFEYESQILARLRHPGIAQIYEAGTHGANGGGVPYFVMEYIPNALPITEYVSQKKLATHERLELFGLVCDAVHHGHQRGIIHRDLKPANILIDSSGRPKVIDFGVARATDSDIALTTLQTDVGQLIGTLQYMSPEQCQADPHDLDTRSDVYSLGVVLYELLCDRLPYDVTHAPVPEAVRVIRDETPVRPSTVNRTLRGDLETVVLKSLQKDRQRRYQSAAELAGDISRFLHHEPIVARPPSALYQFRKFARRHRALVGGATAVFVALVGGTVGTTLGMYRAFEAEEDASIQAETAGQIATFIEEMLSGLDPAVAQGKDTTLLRLILEESAERIEAELSDLPEVEAAIRNTIGDTYSALGEYALAEPHLRRALEIRRRVLGDDDRDTLASITNMGFLLDYQGKLEEAETYYREALEGCRRILGDDDPDTLAAINNMGQILQFQGKLKEAEAYVREALEGRRRVHGDDALDTLATINNMGVLLQAQGRLDEAEPYAREALEGSRRLLGDDHPTTLTAINNMGGLLQEQGRHADAEPYYREALEGFRRVLGDDHHDTLGGLINIGALLLEQGRLDEAEPYYREALEGCRRVLGDEHPTTLVSINSMGVLLQSKGRLADAEPYYHEALEGSRRLLGDDHPDTLVSINNMGFLLHSQGRLAEAEPYYREALEGRRRVLGDDHLETLASINNMGGLLEAQGRLSEAEPYFRQAVKGTRRVLGEQHPQTLAGKSNLASLLRELGQYEEAIALHQEVIADGREALPEGHWYIGVFLSHYGLTLRRAQRFEEGEAAFLESYAILEATLGADHDRTIKAADALRSIYEAWGRPDDAAAWRARGGGGPDEAAQGATARDDP